MRRMIGHLLVVVGSVLMVVLGLWGFIVELVIVYDVFGMLGVVVGLILFPVTFFLAPWYALFADGNWFPLVLVYGGGIPGHYVAELGRRLVATQSSTAPTVTDNLPKRTSPGTVYFPDHYSIGTIEFLRPAEPSVEIEARGAVFVPNEVTTRFTANSAYFSDNHIDILNTVPRLTQLRLSNTTLSDEGAVRLEHSNSLRELDLSDTLITDRTVHSVSDIPYLLWLRLSGTKITDHAVPYLLRLEHLEFLDLSGTEVSDDGIVHLSDLVWLRGIDLSGTRATDQAISDLGQRCFGSDVYSAGGLLFSTSEDIDLLTEDEDLETSPIDPSIDDQFELGASGDRYAVAFPSDRSIGIIDVLDESGIWQEAGVAKGVMHFPSARPLRFSSGSLFLERNITVLPKLTSLQSLSLRSDIFGSYVRERLTDESTATLSLLVHLQELDLSGNEITDEGFANLRPLKHLETLYLDETWITDNGLIALEALPRLRELSLSETNITGIGFGLLSHLPEIEILSLFGTQVDASGLEAIGNLTTIRDLNLSHTLADDAGIYHIRSLHRLRRLELRRTYVTDDGLAHLAQLINLEGLDLSETVISDHGLTHLRSLHNLTDLDVGQTCVSDAGLDELSRSLPRLEV